MYIWGQPLDMMVLFLDENICCGYSLEAPCRGASNEYPQHMFLLRNKKDISIFWMKEVPYLLLCEVLQNFIPLHSFTYDPDHFYST